MEGDVVGDDCFPLQRLTEIVGDDHAHHCPALIHLVMADSAYSNRPDQESPGTEGGWWWVSHQPSLCGGLVALWPLEALKIYIDL